MNVTASTVAWVRRAKPLLGTIVEVGALGQHARVEDAVRGAFEAVADIQAQLSRFEPASDITRFHATPSGTSIAIGKHAGTVLMAAQTLRTR